MLEFLSFNALSVGMRPVFLAVRGIFVSLLGNLFIKLIVEERKIILHHTLG
jgi:hypothetical protein